MKTVFHLNTNADWGGGEYQVLGLLRGLASHGWRPVLFARAGGELFRRAASCGIDVRPIPAFAAALRLAGVMRRERPAMLHVHDSGGVGIGGRAGLAAGVPVVLTRRVASPLRDNWVSRCKYSSRRLAHVIAISETVRDVFLKGGYPADRVTVVPSGLDLEALAALDVPAEFQGTPKSGRHVIGIGKLSPKKNWGLMIEAAARVKSAYPDVRWLLAGDGPEREALEELARSRGVGDCVRFLGFRTDAAALLKGCDLLFFPSLREGASVTVRQAMALGVPVASADAPGTMESLAGHGWIFPGTDPDAAARCVSEVLAGGERVEAVRRAAQASARERFDIRGTVAGTVAVYERIGVRTP